MNVNREELAWAAGFFDGEGCVGLITPDEKFRRVPFVAVAITQVDRRVLDRFAAAVGVGRVYGPTKSYGTSQPQHRYIASHQPRSQAICALLWTWLSPVKRAQFREALAAAVAVMGKPCEHGGLRSKCQTCVRRRGRDNMRAFRERRFAHTLLVAV